MRTAAVLCALMLAVGVSTAPAAAQDAVRPRVEPVTAIDTETFARVLLGSTTVELEALPGGHAQPYQVRLWRQSVERSCGPAGHLICAYRYYLAVGEPGEGDAAVAVYDLGELGTLTPLVWRSGEGDAEAVLEVSVLNHPEHVFAFWPVLQRREARFRLHVTPRALSVEPVGG